MTSNSPLDIIIMAAGEGTRMCSERAKVLHLLAGRPLLEHVLTTAQSFNPRSLQVVIGCQAEQIQQAFPHAHWLWVIQKERLGTGHAVKQALTDLPLEGRTLILSGDVPLITAETLEKLIAGTPSDAIGILTSLVDNPKGLGRIVRDQKNQFMGIIEEKDATPIQKLILEINSGIYIFPNSILHTWLPKITNHNAQKEYYLPSVIDLAKKDNHPITTVLIDQSGEAQGINDRNQLAQAERFLQRKMAAVLMQSGVTLMDPQRIDIRGVVKAEQDVTVDINVIFSGEVHIGSGTTIGSNNVLTNVTLGKNVYIKNNCVIEGATIADHSVIGPFAHIRPGTILDEHVKIGNFVELKKAQVGAETKINHLSYIGDAIIGKQVNIGAGTITCNYDGQHKHVTHIADHAFIGSNTALVAPVNIGEQALIGAGSVIVKDAPAHQLTLSRSEQKTFAADLINQSKKKDETCVE